MKLYQIVIRRRVNNHVIQSFEVWSDNQRTALQNVMHYSGYVTDRNRFSITFRVLRESFTSMKLRR